MMLLQYQPNQINFLETLPICQHEQVKLCANGSQGGSFSCLLTWLQRSLQWEPDWPTWRQTFGPYFTFPMCQKNAENLFGENFTIMVAITFPFT